MPKHRYERREPTQQFKKEHIPHALGKNTRWLEHLGQISLAILGLLCHLFIFQLLSLPYTHVENGIWATDCTLISDKAASAACMAQAIPTITGWDVMGFLLLLPVISYVASLLPKKVLKAKWVEWSLYTSSLVNLGGFLVVRVLLRLSLMQDHDNVAWRDSGYADHLRLLWIAVIASIVISLGLGFWTRRTQKLQLMQIERSSS